MRPVRETYKPDPVDEFLKQYEQQHKNKSTYNEQSYNNYNENTTQSKGQIKIVKAITVIGLQKTAVLIDQSQKKKQT